MGVGQICRGQIELSNDVKVLNIETETAELRAFS